ncbi:hypothetical protein NBRC116494_31130 [Aurantivibrio plasticivorans]
MTVNAFIQLISRSDEGGPWYQWRRCDESGAWVDEPQQGGLDEIQEELNGSEITLLIDGSKVVTQSVGFSSEERKHLRSLVPYEIEEQLASELDDLHFALGNINDDKVVTAYLDNEWLAQQFEELESCGVDIMHAFPEPLLLPREDNAWTLSVGETLSVHYGEGLGFSLELGLANIVLQSLCNEHPLPEELLLIGENQDVIRDLYARLPETLRESVDQEHTHTLVADEWQRIAVNHVASVDLRQGSYARQLPFKRWFKEWRPVAILGAVALFAFVAVNVAQIQVLDSKRAKLMAQGVEVYRQVVPEGRVQDPEKQLKRKVAEFETTPNAGSLMEFYSKVAPLIANNNDISLRSLRYTNQTGDLQLTLEASSYGSVVSLSDAINSTGLQARLQNTSQQGGQQQARMIVSRSTL